MQLNEAKASSERLNEESGAVAAVVQALRHCGVFARPETIRVQREPFASRGARAEAFANGTRFAKERLWHVEIAFAETVRGPLVIGDGRYLGLGIMAPLQDGWRDAMAFQISPQADIAPAQAARLLHAARRALMALSRDDSGRVARLFSGHEADGRPASSGWQEHIFLAADDADRDGRIDRLIIAAPWVCDRSGERPSLADRVLLDRVVSALGEVGPAVSGSLRLEVRQRLRWAIR
jgi:CRISPR-associated protein Csb2